MAIKDTSNVVFFDGVCNLCNKSVNFLIRVDKKKKLKYSSLQSHYAKSNLDTTTDELMNSIVFLTNGKEYRRSKAVLKILITLGGFYKFTGLLFSIFPSFFLDVFYNLVAKNRYKAFGKKDTCRIPKKEEQSFFIE